MEQLVIAAPPDGSIGALLRAYRHWALLSQEQLAARAGLSERTVRDLEAGRVRTPRTDTMRLLADALQLSGPERESWLAAARRVNHQRAVPGPGVPAQLPGNVPARPPGRSGSGMGNSRRCRRWPVRELPAEIVELGRRDNGPGGPEAQDADLAETPVRAWANQTGPDAGGGSGGRLSCADRRELAELRRENRRLRDDVETLKRAAVIFATATR
jgi:transposase